MNEKTIEINLLTELSNTPSLSRWRFSSCTFFHLPLSLSLFTGTCCNASSNCSIQPAVTTSSSAEMENASLKAKDVTVAMTAKMELTRDIVQRTSQQNREDVARVNSVVEPASALAKTENAIVMLIVEMEVMKMIAVSVLKIF